MPIQEDARGAFLAAMSRLQRLVLEVEGLTNP
jgi:hypothetical protein